jgi:hypothetical protein
MANTGTFSSTEEVMNETRVQPNKKKYVHPKIFVYGNLNELTRAVGGKGNSDGGAGKTIKTSK